MTEIFIEAWREANTVAEVAERMGMTEGSARTTAWKLRSLGHDLPHLINNEALRAAGKKGGTARGKNEGK